jgi:hypothetical protein
MNDALDKVITPSRMQTLRARGVLILDVDDTLLARRNGSTADGEKFGDSPAALMLPQLLHVGVRVALMTGHGWEQLDERLIKTFLQQISKEPSLVLNDHFYAYANRGATRIIFDGSTWRLDEKYARGFVFSPDELKALTAILTELADILRAHTNEQRIESREDSILSLRTVGIQIPDWELVRHHLVALGRERLEKKGYASRFQITPAGKNSVEIASTDASKSFACADLFARIGGAEGCTSDQVRANSLYIGDEFEPEGNDKEVALAFRDLQCISVGAHANTGMPHNIIQADLHGSEWGPPSTAAIITSILKVLD